MKIQEEAEILEQVRQAKAGDRAAFARLFELLAADLFAWAELRIPRKNRRFLEPADLVQEVWYRAFQAIARYDESKAPFRYWMFRVAKNVLLETARKADHPDRGRGIGQSTGHLAIHSAPDEATTVTRRLTRNEELASFVEDVRSLEEHEQELLVFCGLEGMPHAKVGERLGISTDAVSKRWQRLRQRLRR